VTTPSSTLGDRLKEWAQAQLQVDADAGLDRVRAAYLQQAMHGNGAANPFAREALLILTGRTKAARPVLALDAVEEALQRDVDDLASRFFALPPPDRLALWQALAACGQGFVRVAARLTALRPGAEVAVPPLDGASPLGELATTVCKLFVLRPAARAAARQAFLEDVDRRIRAAALQGYKHGSRRRASLPEPAGDRPRAAWGEAAQRLRKSHPALAALEPELVRRLADGAALARERQQLADRMRRAIPAIGTGDSGESSSSNRWVRLLPLLIGLGLLRLLSMGSSGSRNQAPPPPQPPAFIHNQPAPDGGWRPGPEDADIFFKKAVPDGFPVIDPNEAPKDNRILP